MHVSIAKNLAGLLQKYSNQDGSYYIKSWELKEGQLNNFHQWADNRPCEGAFQVIAEGKSSLWLVIVDWKQTNNYYLALFPENRTGPLAEIHECLEDHGLYTLRWEYNPIKRDGKNAERRAYFEQAFKSREVYISVPKDIDEVEDFFSELFSLAASRQKADVLDPVRPPVREGFPEGKLKERLHYARERNSELIRQAKQIAIEKYGALQCACCKFDFEKAYGERGKGFIEAHHTKPVSDLHVGGEKTKLEDIALVCANCHRMLHRYRPWLEMHQLSQLLKSN